MAPSRSTNEILFLACSRLPPALRGPFSLLSACVHSGSNGQYSDAGFGPRAPGFGLKRGSARRIRTHFASPKARKPKPALPLMIYVKTPNTYSAFWVGIDGYSSQTVEQPGTLSDCSGETPQNLAYEFYPADLTEITSVTVKPGNKQ